MTWDTIIGGTLATIGALCLLSWAAVAVLVWRETRNRREDREDAATFGEPTRAEIELDMHAATTPGMTFFTPEQQRKADRIRDRIRANQRARFEREALEEIEQMTGGAA